MAGILSRRAAPDWRASKRGFALKIEYLYTRAIGRSAQADEALAAAIAATGVDAEVTYTEVSDGEDARAKKFLGSPSIRVGGFDVEYAEREPDEYQAGTRYYNSYEGWKPYPTAGLIEKMIRAVQAAEKK